MLKRFVFCICMIVCAAHAETITLKWLNEGGTSVSSTTTCESGGNVTLPPTPTKTGYTFQGWKIKSYTLVEYLESTGEQYIDTGVFPKHTLRIQTKVTPYTDYIIFGSRVSESKSFLCSFSGNNGILLDYGSGLGYSRITTGNYVKNQTYDLELGNRYIKNLTSNQILSSGTSVSFTQIDYPIYLFGLDSSGQFSGSTRRGVMYYLKIYDNDVLVRDFIPVLDYNDVPCMFDKVTTQYFYNQGSGNFIAGPTLLN